MKVRITVSKADNGKSSSEKAYAVTYKNVSATEEVVEAFKRDFGWCFDESGGKATASEGSSKKR